MTSPTLTLSAAPEALWRAGTLTADDLERLAGQFRPSWEVGLDVASQAALVPAIVPTAGGFHAPSPAVAANLVGMEGRGATSGVPVPASHVRAPAPRLHGVPMNAVATSEPAQAAPVRRAGRGALFGAVGGIVVIGAAVALFALRGSSPPPAAALPASASEPPAAEPSTPIASPPATPAAVVAPVPAAPEVAEHRPVPPPSHVTPPAPVAARVPPPPPAVAPHAPPRPASVPVVHAPAHRVVAAARAHAPTPAPHPRAASAHQRHGGGFVVDSPY